MKIYTSVALIGDTIFYRGISSSGQREEYKTKYTPYLFAPSKAASASKYKTLEGKAVDKIEFESISEAKEFLKQYEDVSGFTIYGQTHWLPMFLYDTFPKNLTYDRKKINVASIDIEVESANGFPDPETATKEITAISISHKGTIKLFGTKPYDPEEGVVYSLCKSEDHLLMRFLDTWEELDLDIITGWNIEGFDIPYIVNRIRNVLGEDMALRLSPWRKWTKHKVVNFAKEYLYNFPLGVYVLDYLDLYKKFGYTVQENYKLDTVAKAVLGDKKVKYEGTLDELYENDPKKFYDYNVHDTRLIDRLDAHLGLIDLFLTMAYDNRIPYEDAFTTVRFWDTIIHNHMLDKGLVVPLEKHNNKEEYPGAYVKEPIPGLYEWVVSFDVASEYPSIIMQANISPETYRGKISEEYSVDDLLEGKLSEKCRKFLTSNNLSLTANGSLWDRSKKGIFGELVEKMFAERQKYRNLMKDAKKELQEIDEEIARRSTI